MGILNSVGLSSRSIEFHFSYSSFQCLQYEFGHYAHKTDRSGFGWGYASTHSFSKYFLYSLKNLQHMKLLHIYSRQNSILKCVIKRHCIFTVCANIMQLQECNSSCLTMSQEFRLKCSGFSCLGIEYILDKLEIILYINIIIY